jgi:hypothetical protein
VTYDPRQVAALITAQATVREKAATAAARYVQARVAAMPDDRSWWHTAAVLAMAQQAVRRVEASQIEVAGQTDSFLTRLLSLLTGRPPRAAGVVRVADLRPGVPHVEVYARLADQYRYQRSSGVPAADALRLVRQRAAVVAETDVTLAFRQQVKRSLASARDVVGYRRIVHPELSRGGTCGLCIAASDRIYHVGDLLPIHARCACTVAPVTKTHDPGRSLNTEDLAALYERAGSTAAAALKRTRYSVHEHGELGPVLAAEGDNFRGPADVPAA